MGLEFQLQAIGGSGETTAIDLNSGTENVSYGTTTINSYKVVKEAILFEQPIPTMDSNANIAIDMLGTKRNITISGTVVGTIAQLNEFIHRIDGKIYGQQFTNTYGGCVFFPYLLPNASPTYYYVILKSFTYEWLEAETTKLGYTLEMVEGHA